MGDGIKTGVSAALTAALLGGGALAFHVSAAKPNTSTPGCSVASVRDTTIPYWWLDVKASGLDPDRWYSVFATLPDGRQLGTIAYADGSGAFDNHTIATDIAGTYTVTVNNYHGGSVKASCATSVS